MRFNFQSAINYIKERRTTAKTHVKKDMSGAKVSMATPADRKRYLAYGISILEEVSPGILRQMPNPGTYTQKGAAKMLRHLLILRCSGCSTARLAQDFKVPEGMVNKLENMAIMAVKEAIQRKRDTGVPVLGG